MASVTYEEVYDGQDSAFTYATHFSYDIAGNVRQLVQDMPELLAINHRYKRIGYEYDLVSASSRVPDSATVQRNQALWVSARGASRQVVADTSAGPSPGPARTSSTTAPLLHRTRAVAQSPSPDWAASGAATAKKKRKNRAEKCFDTSIA